MKSQTELKRIGYLLEKTSRIVKLSYLQAFSELGIDITPEQWVLLDQLYQKGGQSQNELAVASSKDAPNISRIIDLLCKKGLTERNRIQDDRRRYNVILTDHGKALVKKSLGMVERLREQGWKHLNEEDYNTFIRIMKQIVHNYTEELPKEKS